MVISHCIHSSDLASLGKAFTGTLAPLPERLTQAPCSGVYTHTNTPIRSPKRPMPSVDNRFPKPICKSWKLSISLTHSHARPPSHPPTLAAFSLARSLSVSPSPSSFLYISLQVSTCTHIYPPIPPSIPIPTPFQTNLHTYIPTYLPN